MPRNQTRSTSCWSRQGDGFATAATDSIIRIWDSESFEPTAELSALFHSQGNTIAYHPILDWHPDGSRIVVAFETILQCWNTTSEAPVWTTVILDKDTSVTFDAGGRLLSDHADLVEQSFVYIVENDDGTKELLPRSEFLNRVPAPQ